MMQYLDMNDFTISSTKQQPCSGAQGPSSHLINHDINVIQQWRTERGGLGCSNPPRNSEDTGGVLDRTSKKNRRLDFLL